MQQIEQLNEALDNLKKHSSANKFNSSVSRSTEKNSDPSHRAGEAIAQLCDLLSLAGRSPPDLQLS